MKKFNFKVNEYGDVCHIFKDNEDVPVDVVYFLETAEDGNTWIPKSIEVQKLLESLTEDLNDVMEFYNENYIEICEVISPKHLLRLPERVDGFYMNYGISEISECGGHFGYGVVHTREQAEAMESFCRLSHIIPVYNEGWTPNWHEKSIKWCIETVQTDMKLNFNYYKPCFLAFETEEKAKLFFKEKIDDITALSKGGII
jgi:hypothetical protein